jgi:hypothetical protein
VACIRPAEGTVLARRQGVKAMIIWAPVFPGHRWVLTYGIVCAAEWPVKLVHRVEGHSDLAPLFRDDLVSNRISFENIDGFGFIAINAMKAVTMSKDHNVSREAAADRSAIAEDLNRRVREHLLTA